MTTGRCVHYHDHSHDHQGGKQQGTGQVLGEEDVPGPGRGVGAAGLGREHAEHVEAAQEAPAQCAQPQEVRGHGDHHTNSSIFWGPAHVVGLFH